MAKDAAVTVRIPGELKARLEERARRERRSLSAQIATELERAVEEEPALPGRKAGKLLGLFAGARVPTERDFLRARRLLWGVLGSKRRG